MAHREEMARRFGAGFELLGVAEQLPRAENHVALSERTDRFGVPLARVETHLDRTDLEVLSAMWKRLGELGEAAGVERFVGQVSAYDVPAATHVGSVIAERLKGVGVSSAVLDRGGYVFHGRVKAIAEAAREAGLKF